MIKAENRLRDLVNSWGRVSIPFRSGSRWRSVALATTFTSLTICSFSAAIGAEVVKNPAPATVDSTAAQPGATASRQDAAAAQRAGESGPNWDVMLQTLMTSPAQRDFMGDLQELIRKGDTAGAKQLLTSAVDMGTLAIVVTDHVEDPALLASLKRLVGDRQSSPARPEASIKDKNSTGADESRIAELKSSLEQERNRADAASQQLSSLQDQLATALAGTAKVTELENALGKAKEQAASAARQLESVQGQIAGMKEKDATAAEFKAAAAREKERADAAQSKVAALQGQLASLDARAAEAVELKAALGQERERAVATSRELEKVKEQYASLQAVRSQASELKAALDQEKERAIGTARELEKVKEQFASLQAVRSQAAELKAALDQEKERSASYARDLRTASEQLATFRTSTTKVTDTTRELEAVKAELAVLKSAEIKAAQFKDALDREKERADAALRQLNAVSAQLASARTEVKEVDTTATLERKNERAAPVSDDASLKRMLTAAMSDYVAAKDLNEALAQEKARTRSMARQLEAAQAQLAMLGNRTGFTPAALLFRHPMMLERTPEDAERGKTEDKSRKAAPRMAPSAALPKAEKPEPSGKVSVGLPQTSKEQIKPEAPKPTPRLGKETASGAERISARNEPRRAPAAREADSPPSARALFLPPTLKPIDEEWEFQ